MLTEREIRPGIVAYFEVAMLNGDPAVDKPPSPATRNGPFLCYARAGEQSAWVEITSQRKEGRFELHKGWRSGGARTWQQDGQYLNDGATTYRGPNSSFVTASGRIDRYGCSSESRRPQVNPEGAQAIREEVQRRGGHQL